MLNRMSGRSPNSLPGTGTKRLQSDAAVRCRAVPRHGSETKRDRRLAHLAHVGLAAFLLAGCGGSEMSGLPPTAEQIKRETLTRVQSATTVLASDQHVFRYDGQTSRTFTVCSGTVCGVSPTAGELQAALARALADARLDFGSSHFAARLEDSLELRPEIKTVNGVTLVEGYGLRAGERAFSARFFGAWLEGGAFFVNKTTLTVRNERGDPVGLGTVFDASALGVTGDAAPAPVQGKSATWTGMMIGADVSDTVTRGQFLRGDATLVIDDLANPDVDVAFSDLQDLETGARLADRVIAPWQDIPLDGGSFGNKPVGSDDYIQGRFVGEDHAGVVGIFERDDVVGSFGGALQPRD